MPTLTDVLTGNSLIAILRGVTPETVIEVASVLTEKEFKCLEVPMNSPNPLKSIELLAAKFGDTHLIGAGTVTSANELTRIKNHGGTLIIMPHTDITIIQEAKRLGLFCIPGFSTATEAYSALNHGADAIKFFPAATLGTAMLKSIKTILPKNTKIVPTGGITPQTLEAFVKIGVDSLGLGGELYKPSYSINEITERANKFVYALRKIKDA